MKHGSLFSGGGGFDLAAEWMGWSNLFHCEINEFCNRILNYYWPNAKSYTNIKETDFAFWRGKVNILTGGFPCQPYSVAGKRKGKDDDRHLWPEMLRAVREIQPNWIVGENVYGLINWNKGLVFDEVQANLEVEGYEVWPIILPACSINAPHRRERIWFVAHSLSDGHGKKARLGQNSGTKGTNKEKENKRERIRHDLNGNGQTGLITHATSIGQQKQGKPKFRVCNEAENDWEASWSNNVGRWPVESPVFIRNDGIPGKLDGITISDWLEESHRMIGNAIVPQLALKIFKTIEQYETQLK